VQVEELNSIAERLIQSHNTTRRHLLNLIGDVSSRQWKMLPEKSVWSIQTTCAEILNYEIQLCNKTSKDAIDEVSEEFTLEQFWVKQKELSDHLIIELRNENTTKGFIFLDEKLESIPSFHWIMVRTIQHSVYHSSGISVLRPIVGLPRGNYTEWESMVDSVFLSALN